MSRNVLVRPLPLTQEQMRQAIQDARRLDEMALHGHASADALAIMTAILCLRPTETTVVDVEYKQLTDGEEKNAA